MKTMPKAMREFLKLDKMARDSFFEQLKEYPLPPYKVMRWSRDCDMCESTNVYTVRTYVKLIADYVAWIDSLEWAEGPETWEVIDPMYEDYSGTRDRVMEAYENGNGTSIYV